MIYYVYGRKQKVFVAICSIIIIQNNIEDCSKGYFNKQKWMSSKKENYILNS